MTLPTKPAKSARVRRDSLRSRYQRAARTLIPSAAAVGRPARVRTEFWAAMRHEANAWCEEKPGGKRKLDACGLCVPKTSSTSCDQAIFVDQATDASLFSDAVLVEVDRFG